MSHIQTSNELLSVDAAAGLERIVEQDPFDQALVAALSPVLDPLATYISRTPVISNTLAALIGQNTPVVSTPSTALFARVREAEIGARKCSVSPILLAQVEVVKTILCAPNCKGRLQDNHAVFTKSETESAVSRNGHKKCHKKSFGYCDIPVCEKRGVHCCCAGASRHKCGYASCERL